MVRIKYLLLTSEFFAIHITRLVQILWQLGEFIESALNTNFKGNFYREHVDSITYKYYRDTNRVRVEYNDALLLTMDLATKSRIIDDKEFTFKFHNKLFKLISSNFEADLGYAKLYCIPNFLFAVNPMIFAHILAKTLNARNSMQRNAVKMIKPETFENAISIYIEEMLDPKHEGNSFSAILLGRREIVFEMGFPVCSVKFVNEWKNWNVPVDEECLKKKLMKILKTTSKIIVKDELVKYKEGR